MLEFFKQIHICLLCCVENKDDKNHKPSFFPNSMYSNHFCRTFSRLYFTGLCNVYIDSGKIEDKVKMKNKQLIKDLVQSLAINSQ